MTNKISIKFYKGGTGSGHRGHSGRPGKRGGSLPGTGGGTGQRLGDFGTVEESYAYDVAINDLNTLLGVEATGVVEEVARGTQNIRKYAIELQHAGWKLLQGQDKDTETQICGKNDAEIELHLDTGTRFRPSTITAELLK